MKIEPKDALAVRCPTCGAKPGEKCELSTGLPRTEPHRDRRLAASETRKNKWRGELHATVGCGSSEPKLWMASFTAITAAALSFSVGIGICNNPCRSRFGGGTKES